MWEDYASLGCWDEMLVAGCPRDACGGVVSYVRSLGAELLERQQAAELAIRTMCITFTVYAEAGDIDRAWPFDVIPRVISSQEWTTITAGLVQRLTAINRSSMTSTDRPRSSTTGWCRPSWCMGRPTSVRNAWASILTWACGPTSAAATWSGTRMAPCTCWRTICASRRASHTCLENRQPTRRVFADLFRDLDIRPVDGYPTKLRELLASLSPRRGETPTMVVLTPGIFNSAYFEHAYLTQQVGAYLVEGHDLVVDTDDCLYMSTISGRVRVDVVY
jgi:uncharacterized circularly permuted ATP-grasp superfamily protein